MTSSPANPYPGLRPFDLASHGLFFGRQVQISQLLDRLGRHRFLMVVGSSGSGKSSLIRAGLVPALSGESGKGAADTHWTIAVLSPGGQPLANLARALDQAWGSSEAELLGGPSREETLAASSLGLIDLAAREQREGYRLLVVVDQFEELFRFEAGSRDQDPGRLFVRLLLESAYSEAVQVHVLSTMRAEFVGECARFPGLAEALNRSLYVVPHMRRSELREVIEQPALQGGLQIAPRLVQRLLNDLGSERDALPVLQHCLRRTWAACMDQADSVVDLDHYLAVGTLTHALSRHADEILEGLGPEGCMIAQKLFQSLSSIGEGGQVYRHPTRLSELCAILGCEAKDVTAVVEAFRHPEAGFLMPPPDVSLTDDQVIDISHESLLRGWATLRSWIEEEVVSERTYRRLVDTAQMYAEGRASLLRDPELQMLQEWAEATRPTLAWASRYGGRFEETMAFLEMSVRARARERAREEEHRRYRRRPWWLRIVKRFDN